MTTTVDYRIGDVFAELANIPDHSVDLIVTSPPFLALRSYLPADHPDKAKEIGSEPTPAAFLDTMLALTAEWRRVLTPTGSIAVEIGDTYSGSKAESRDDVADGSRRWGGQDGAATLTGFRGGTVDRTGDAWPLAKSLCGIPTLYAWSLAYGCNLLTGQPSPAGQWRIRNLLTWTRPNPPVGALGDKFRPATSFVTIACTSDKRWFDLDAVRGETLAPSTARPEPGLRHARDIGSGANHAMAERTYHANGGAPPLDWHDDWQPLHRLPTAPYPGAHYATYPLALPTKLIEAMCPRQVCRVCGEARRRITTADYEPHGIKRNEAKSVRGFGVQNGEHAQAFEHGRATKHTTTLGWSDCGCLPPDWPVPHPIPHRPLPKYRPGVVLDPFAGSGTTLLAAALTGRDAIGIDLDSRNHTLAYERIADACHISGTSPWSVTADLPGLKGEHPDQQSLFDGDVA